MARLWNNPPLGMVTRRSQRAPFDAGSQAFRVHYLEGLREAGLPEE